MTDSVPPSRSNARSTTARGRREPPRHRARWPRRFLVALVLLALAGLPFGALAFAARDAQGTVPDGVLIGGVDVGGMSAGRAEDRLAQQIGVPANRAVKVVVDGETYRIGGRRAGVRVNIARAVRRAVARGEDGSFLERGWRAVTGGKVRGEEPVRISVDRAAVKAFVDGIAEEVAVPAQEASLSIAVDSISVTEGSDGQALADPEELVDEIVAQFKSTTSERRVEGEIEVVRPTATSESLLSEDSTIVTVSKADTTARVFVGGELTKTYHVAVGSAEYPTPEGTFTVQSMQVDPPWNVPNSEWAGDLAGQTIPGGAPDNPLKARWIGFNGAVGFHGTADVGSLGSAASHGCVRMDPKDVIDLYERVEIGTTVYVA